MGARKFSIVSVPPLGCLPSQRLRQLKQTGTQGCFEPLNYLSLGSYPMLAEMLQELADELPGMPYSLGDSSSMVSFVFSNPRTKDWSKRSMDTSCTEMYRLIRQIGRQRFFWSHLPSVCLNVPAGFTDLVEACCGGGPYGAAYPCNGRAPLCLHRDEYLFWDANHPTQAASAIAAQTLFAGNRTFVGPINVKELALLWFHTGFLRPYRQGLLQISFLSFYLQ
jgi:hypothetical protein